MRRVISASVAVGLAAVYQRNRFGYALQQCSADGNTAKNYAFVFIKPHANTPAARDLVSETLHNRGVRVLSEGEISGETIDREMLVDQHYYAIASKATLLKPQELNVNSDKFQERFGLSWQDAVSSGKVFNALDACNQLGISTEQIEDHWNAASKAGKIVKLGGGFYCALIDTVPGKAPIYTLNAFFMSMRGKFVIPGTSIHYYNVEFDPAELSWGTFRGKVLGPTNPADAPSDSLRGMIMHDWKRLGLKEAPNTGDNGVHASASPFEGLAERMNWLKIKPDADLFGARLKTETGISSETIAEWSVDPAVQGKSIFDRLEDKDSAECISSIKSLLPTK